MAFSFAAIGFEHPHIYSMINGLNSLEGAELVAIADGNQELLTSAALKYDVPTYDDYRRMLDDVNPQAIALAAVNNEKAEILIECIKRGIHVYADKPLLTSEEDLNKVEEALNARNVVISLHLTYRYMPMTYTIKRAIDDGKIGKVVYSIINLPHRLNIPMRSHAMLNETLNGGVIVDIGCHGYDLVRWYTGSELDEVTAYHGNMRFTERIDFKDYGLSFFRMKDQSVALVGADWLSPDGGGGKPLMLIVGTKGTLEFKYETKEVHFYSNEAPPEVLPNVAPELSMAEDFLSAIKSPAHERVLTNRDILEAMRGIILAGQAAQKGETVRVK
jgi:predicted dehydrogenase